MSVTSSEEGEIDPSGDARSFGELLKWFRRREKLTQQQVADQLEVRRSTISEWENSQFAPRYRDRVAKLAEIFHLSPVETNNLLQAAIFHVAPPPPTFEPHNPYKGLAAFTQADHHQFFGREALVHDLISVLQQVMVDQTKPRLLAVIGPSGSGKTSVIQAGLLPELKLGAIAGSEDWVYIEPFRPRRDPLSSVADAFSQALGRDPDDIRQDLEVSPLGLCQLALSLTSERKRPVVLVVDQFEELFSLDAEEQVRQPFIHLLVRACSEPESSILLLLVCRADCYSSLAAYSELARLVAACQQLILPLDHERETLRRIIEQPAGLPNVKLTFEGNLVDEILFDLHQQVGILPLLQFTLDQLFQRRENHRLTMQAYQDLGRVNGALAQYVEHLYLNLPSEKHQQLARFLFLRLLQMGKNRADTVRITRRQATLEEFFLLDPRETQMLREVITIFVGRRLLVTNRSGDTSILEVSHEALLQEWPRLGSWIEEAYDDVQFQQSLNRTASEWEQLKKPGDRLYRGRQLKMAQDWAKRNIPSRREQAFLQASFHRHVQFVFSLLLVFLVVCSSIGVAGWFFLHQPADPNIVTTTDDDGIGSLRWALTNTLPTKPINFAPQVRGTITLKRELTINKPLTLRGPGEKVLVLKSLGTYGLHVLSGVNRVSLSDLSFANGTTSEGGAIIQVDSGSTLDLNRITIVNNHRSGIGNSGTMTLSYSTVAGNSSTDNNPGAGGIENRGTMTLSHSMISSNSSSADNVSGTGGIENTGHMDISYSTISENFSSVTGVDAADAGAGGFRNDGVAHISYSMISGNSSRIKSGSDAALSRAGGIENRGTMTLSHSTISGNSSSASALDTADIFYDAGPGGIGNTGMMTISSSTISNNSSKTASPDGLAGAGGIENTDTMAISYSTVSNNFSSGSAGGIGISYGTMALSNSTIFGNSSSASNESSGISITGAKVTLVFCTIVSLTRSQGITIASSIPSEKYRYPSHMTLKNTIVVATSLVIASDSPDSIVQSEGYNLVESANAHFFQQPGDTLIQNPATIFEGGTPRLANNVCQSQP